MPSCFRIVKERFAYDAFSGEGAYEFGGRWNSPGFRVVYTAESLALACLEMLVHLDHSALLSSYVYVEAKFNGRLVKNVEVITTLPADWHRSQGSIELQSIGDGWIGSGKSAILKVPSAVIPNSSNYLINPAHARFADIEMSSPAPIDFDPRLKN
ncbi:MAG: RES domain-containing protein [Acidobacteria bacterium]|nr:MAG: RES domain-containing protein [Acidobacteriota bacterium]REJ98223.1 MAG: RES domain-containing protein [Acidobacteriota bacterium]REK16967.1 MAG: RES domain-containing protein [Acidobacteriota bacterium]REK42877.1 MAG: RES domain-containing protein [Acidobacteriota bacterium]